jgi:hypothetical protein
MKYAKILGLAAMALAALMAFAGTASATTLTSPAGTTYTSTIKAESEGTTELVSELGAFGTIKCKKSTVEGKVEEHGTTVTAGGKISTLTFTECEGGTPTSPVAVPGSLEVHTEGSTSNGNGTLTSKNAKVIVHNTAVGTCEFETSSTGTDLGKLTGGTPAKLVISGVVIRVGGSNPFCGSNSTWKGTYKVTSPSTLLVD